LREAVSSYEEALSDASRHRADQLQETLVANDQAMSRATEAFEAASRAAIEPPGHLAAAEADESDLAASSATGPGAATLKGA
jgi:hypothetical protein